MKYKKWTEQELDYLKNNYNKTNKKLSLILNHPESSIKDKLRKFSIIKQRKYLKGKDNPNWKGGEKFSEVECGYCQKKIIRKNKDIARLKNCFCSKKCRNIYLSKSTSGKNNRRYKHKRISSDGYVLVHNYSHPLKDSENMVKEHRLVMEKHIGRLLTKKEVIHHINNDRQDNRIENLILFKNHSEHIKHHIKLNKNFSNKGVFKKCQ